MRAVLTFCRSDGIPGAVWMKGSRTTSLKTSMKMQCSSSDANMFLWMAMRGTRRTLERLFVIFFVPHCSCKAWHWTVAWDRGMGPWHRIVA